MSTALITKRLRDGSTVTLPQIYCADCRALIRSADSLEGEDGALRCPPCHRGDEPAQPTRRVRRALTDDALPGYPRIANVVLGAVLDVRG